MRSHTKLSGYKLDSEVIKVLRFPLAMMVVFLHAEPFIDGWDITDMNVGNMGANMAGIIMYSISHILTQIAVPIFFVISGYLFFKKLEIWDRNEWSRKMRSRVSSLLIPYLLWVVFFCCVHIARHVVAGHGMAEMLSIVTQWVKEQGGILNLFWSSSVWEGGADNVFGQKVLMSGPMPFHLWFIRDLIVMILLSPLFYVLLHKGNGGRIRPLSAVTVFFLSAAYLAQIQMSVHGIGFTALFYFGMGAFYSLNGFFLSKKLYIYRWMIGLVSLVLFIVLIPMDGGRTEFGILLFPLWPMLTVILAFHMTAIFAVKNKLAGTVRVSDSSFFLYMVHPFMLAAVGSNIHSAGCKIMAVVDVSDMAFANAHPLVTIFLYFVKVLVTTGICIGIYKLLVLIFPRTMKIICGR